jgi:hypothetical protein
MRSQQTVWSACALALVLWARCGDAQALPQTTQQTAEDALHAMSQQAAIIFAGQVVAIRHRDGVNGGTGIVEIDFAVEDAIRGAIGATYTLREWAGLWQTGDAHFSIGQQYLMLLHAPSQSGLSSPVGGMDGAIPIRGSSPPPPTQATQSDSRMIDLRWIGIRVVRPLSYRPATVARQTALPVSIHAYARTTISATAPESESSWTPGTADVSAPAAISEAAQPAAASASQITSYPAMLAILRAWEKSDDAAR